MVYLLCEESFDDQISDGANAFFALQLIGSMVVVQSTVLLFQLFDTLQQIDLFVGDPMLTLPNERETRNRKEPTMIYPFFEFIEAILELTIFALQFVHRHSDGVELGDSGKGGCERQSTTRSLLPRP